MQFLRTINSIKQKGKVLIFLIVILMLGLLTEFNFAKYYYPKNEIALNQTVNKKNFKGDSPNTNCNNANCCSYRWVGNGDSSTITITPSNLPELAIPSSLIKQGMSYSLNFKLDAMTTPGTSFNLMYDYETTGSTKVHTVQIATFSSNNVAGQYDGTHVGSNISVNLGALGDIPQRIYFTGGSGGTGTVDMTISNAVLQVVPMYGKNQVDYDVWNKICSGNSCNDVGDDYIRTIDGSKSILMHADVSW